MANGSLQKWQKSCCLAIQTYLEGIQKASHPSFLCTIDAPSGWGKTELILALCDHFSGLQSKKLPDFGSETISISSPNLVSLFSSMQLDSSKTIAVFVRTMHDSRWLMRRLIEKYGAGENKSRDLLRLPNGTCIQLYVMLNSLTSRGFNADVILIDDFLRTNEGENINNLLLECILPYLECGGHQAVPIVWVGTSDERGRFHASLHQKTYPNWGCNDPFVSSKLYRVQKSIDSAVLLSVYTNNEECEKILQFLTPTSEPVLHYSDYVAPEISPWKARETLH
jgi:hypothetical protein